MKNVIKQLPTQYSVDNYYRFSQLKQSDIKDKRILDIGCGYGWCTLLLKDAGAKHVVGTEITEADLSTAKAHIGDDRISVEVASAIELPFEDNSFDTIVSWEVLEHIPKNTEENMFREVQRVLKPSGTFYMSTPHRHPVSNLLDPAWMLFGHHRHYSKQQLRSYAKQAKLKPEQVGTVGGWWMMLATLNLYISKWIFRRPPIRHDWWQAKIKTDFVISDRKFANLFAVFTKWPSSK